LKLVIITTVPETLATILRGQPNWLSKHLSVICITSPGAMFHAVELQEQIRVIPVPMNRGISPFKDLLSIFRMWRVLRRLNPDVVHSYTPKAGLVTMLGGYLAGVRVRIHTFTGLVFPTSNGFKRTLLIFIDRLICLVATHIVPEGAGVRSDLKENGITSRPLNVIGNGNIAGIDISHFTPNYYQVLEHVPKGDFTFCFVGRLNRDKGLQELVSAFLSLHVNAVLLLVGDIDNTAPIDGATLRQIESHPQIYRTGFLKDIRPAISASDVLVLPSYREGFPNVVLQAGAMSKPVIASDIKGCNEVIEEDFNGWLVPPRDSAALAEKMAYVVSLSAEKLGLMGGNARNRVVERYEQETYRMKLLEFYREIL